MTSGLQVDTDDVLPAQKTSIVVLDEIAVAVSEDEESVCFWPKAATEPRTAGTRKNATRVYA